MKMRYLTISLLALSLLGGCGSSGGNGKGNGNGNGNHGNSSGEHQDNTKKVDVNSYPVYSLSQENKDDIAFMGNEERLAYDVYMYLYNYHK